MYLYTTAIALCFIHLKQQQILKSILKLFLQHLN